MDLRDYPELYLSNFQASSGTITANGGSGGVQSTQALAHYQGNNGVRVSCGGTFNDGDRDEYGSWWAYGGQAGAFGNGGRGGAYSITCTAGGVGAGGGSNVVGSGDAASGGRGQLVVSWS